MGTSYFTDSAWDRRKRDSRRNIPFCQVTRKAMNNMVTRIEEYRRNARTIISRNLWTFLWSRNKMRHALNKRSLSLLLFVFVFTSPMILFYVQRHDVFVDRVPWCSGRFQGLISRVKKIHSLKFLMI